MQAAVIAIIAVVGLASAAPPPKGPATMPDYVKTCRRDRPDLDSCLRTSLQKFLPYLVKGVPELDLPPFDPYIIDDLVSEYANGHVQVKSAVKDVVTYGISDLQFLDVRTNFDDPDNMRLRIEVFVPKMKSEGKFKVQGKFLESDFGSRGTYSLTMTNITALLDLKGVLEKVDGVEYLKLKQFDIKPELDDMKIYATNLYGNNDALTKASLELFNQHWRPVFAEILPYARESWDKIMRNVANRVFLRVPFDQIFPASS